MNYDRQRELQQLRSTEAHILQTLENESDEETIEILMAKYRRTQARRREIEEVPA